MTTPFLNIPESEWIAQNELAFAIRDNYPVTRGHSLVIPNRPVENWFEADADERQAMLELVDELKRRFDRKLNPDGYNLGINNGEAAGQTVEHLHVHLIPRYEGDVEDPGGGVRHVIPDRGNYRSNQVENWEKTAFGPRES